LQELRGTGINAKVFPLLESLTNGTDMRSLSLAAAKHGADALMIIEGGVDRESYARDYALSYALIVPMFFVKGNRAETLFVANATLWDVRNEYLYLSTQSEGNHSLNYPLIFPETDREAFAKSKDMAVDQLQKNLVAMVNGQ
ncbi:MAG: hypothetical protein MJK18_08665, partial [Bdellovibrionales bacterium]|nr:hypothetical protein [Bdellovibrionales bacterium]